MSDEQRSYTPEEIETILASGDIDAMAKLPLDAFDGEALDAPQAEASEGPEHRADDGKTPSEDTPDTAPAPADESTVEGAPASADADESELAVAGKNGGKIPYFVLENARRQAAEAKRQLAELQAQLAKVNQRDATVRERLEAEGLDAEKILSHPEGITEDQFKAIEEVDSDIARVLRHQQRQLDDMRRMANPAPVELPPEVVAVNSAMAATPDLIGWQKAAQAGDPDRWETAIAIDEKLQLDPKWKDAPLDKRFREAARRTAAYFGESLSTPDAPPQPRASQASRAASVATPAPSVPRSLTDIGQASPAQKSDVERLQSMNGLELTDYLASLPEDRRNQLIAEADGLL